MRTTHYVENEKKLPHMPTFTISFIDLDLIFTANIPLIHINEYTRQPGRRRQQLVQITYV